MLLPCSCFFSCRHVNGLVACLYEYLDLSPEHVHFQKVRQKYMQVCYCLLSAANIVTVSFSRAVTKFSSRRGNQQSSQGTRCFWRERVGLGEVSGKGNNKTFTQYYQSTTVVDQ